jgi:drug/metabolite transporter (DMT)-like permease
MASVSFGVLAALAALVCWGVADFLIQRSTRRVGVAPTLLADALIGGVVLLPFAVGNVGEALSPGAFPVLAGALALGLVAAPVNFLAFQRGKLSVVSPILTLELFITILLGALFLSERLSTMQLGFSVAVFVGIVLATVRSVERGSRIEAGAFLALLGAIGLGLANILNGTGARLVGPTTAVWVVRIGFVLFVGLWLVFRGRWARSLHGMAANARLLVPMGMMDTTAWLAYGYAVTVLPIGLAVAIAQGYVALSVVLGVAYNREHLRPHQVVGVVLAIAASVTLAAISG